MTQTSNILNGVDRDALNATLDAVRQRPEIAQVTFTLGTS